MRVWQLIAAFVVPLTTAAQPLDDGSLRYCLERAKTALSVATSLSEGLNIDQINLAFFSAPADAADNDYREAWIQALKVETATAFAALPAGPHRAERAAQKIAEVCAYAHGKKRRIKHAASSESLGNEPRQRELCREQLVDEIYIGQAVAQRAPREHMEQRARHNAERLGEERFKRILGLLHEAYGAPNIQDWFDAKLSACMSKKDL